MRARTIREGSVGLLILVGVALFGGLVLWLQGLNPRQRSYQLTLQFENALAMQEGTVVRYRGVPVGRVQSIDPDTNQVDVMVEITESSLLIPKDALFEVNQSGLIGETTIDITPQTELSEAQLALSPVAEDCNSDIIVCSDDRILGEVGVSYESLLRSAEELASALGDPQLMADLQGTLQRANALTERAVVLVEDVRRLTLRVEPEIPLITASVRRATDRAGDAAEQVELTALEVNSLLQGNQGRVVQILDSLGDSSLYVRDTLATLSPALQQSTFIADLNQLSADAAAAAADLRNITGSLNSTENLLLLQQTLESARSVFQNAQKVMADVDELTGDPALRDSIRDLINGLSGLVSSSEQLEQEMQLAQVLTQGQLPATSLQLMPAESAAATGPLLTYQGRSYRLAVQQTP